MNAFSELDVTVSNPQGETHTLTYSIKNTLAAQTWAQRLSLSVGSGIWENSRFYNFPGNPKSNIQEVLRSIEGIVKQLKDFHPGLAFPALDEANLQKSVNEMHFNFAHSHHVTKLITRENHLVWRDFNVLLHTIEEILRSAQVEKEKGIPLCRIVFTFVEPNRVPIPDASFQDFTLSTEFGTAYTNYTQTGRHFHEMFCANDDHLDDEHIRPARLLGGNTCLWLGPSSTPVEDFLQNQEMKAWFEARAERFNRLGHYWGDPKLAIGRLPVAKLKYAPQTKGEMLQMIHSLASFNTVSAVQIR